MTKTPFKKLQVWAEAMELARITYAVTKSFPKEELFGLVSQMRRCSLSVPSNIAEGSQRSTDRDFASFISIALGSLAELETQTILAHEFSYLEDGIFGDTTKKIEALRYRLLAFLKRLRPQAPSL